MSITTINDLQALQAANEANQEIMIGTDITLTAPLRLKSGVTLKGSDPTIQLTGATHLIELTENNTIEDLTLVTEKTHDAIFFSPEAVAGTFTLKNVTTHGAVTLTSKQAAGDINVIIDKLAIIEADVTHKKEGP